MWDVKHRATELFGAFRGSWPFLSVLSHPRLLLAVYPIPVCHSNVFCHPRTSTGVTVYPGTRNVAGSVLSFLFAELRCGTNANDKFESIQILILS